LLAVAMSWTQNGLLRLQVALVTILLVTDVSSSTIKPISDVYVGTAGGYEIKIIGSGFQPSFGVVPQVFVGDDECEVVAYRSSDTQVVCPTAAKYRCSHRPLYCVPD
jgi:hypothetical protein